MNEAGNKSIVATVAILAVGAILLVTAALIGSSEEISYPDTFDFQPADYDAGTVVVVSKAATDGMKLLGIEFRKPVYRVDVAFTVPGQECFFALAEYEEWPVPGAPCVGPQHVTGTLAGLGSTVEGDTYVGVSIEVGEACYSAIELGTEWQPGSCP